VVGAILNISRIDLGRIKIAASPQDLVRLTREGVKEVALLAEEKRIRITLSLPDKLPAVNVDETIYTQTLHNLLTNAIRYTQPQKGEVTVELKRAPEGYMLSVRDNGIGIPQYARTHIFERFYRAKNAVGAEAQGSGLGLYLVKVMTDAYGGRLWFESSEGKGTVFYVLIPEAGMVLV
jgi:signal transduction histidine kinase